MKKKASDIVKECLEEKGVTQMELASRLGITRQALGQKLDRTYDMKVSTFVDMLNAIGFDVQIVEKGA